MVKRRQHYKYDGRLRKTKKNLSKLGEKSLFIRLMRIKNINRARGLRKNLKRGKGKIRLYKTVQPDYKSLFKTSVFGRKSRRRRRRSVNASNSMGMGSQRMGSYRSVRTNPLSIKRLSMASNIF